VSEVPVSLKVKYGSDGSSLFGSHAAHHSPRSHEESPKSSDDPKRQDLGLSPILTHCQGAIPHVELGRTSAHDTALVS
jgi:hypothetical protein